MTVGLKFGCLMERRSQSDLRLMALLMASSDFRSMASWMASWMASLMILTRNRPSREILRRHRRRRRWTTWHMAAILHPILRPASPASRPSSRPAALQRVLVGLPSTLPLLRLMLGDPQGRHHLQMGHTCVNGVVGHTHPVVPAPQRGGAWPSWHGARPSSRAPSASHPRAQPRMPCASKRVRQPRKLR